MNEQRSPETDHVSDPAHVPGDGWVGEGGASHLGPATHLTRDPADGEPMESEQSTSEE